MILLYVATLLSTWKTSKGYLDIPPSIKVLKYKKRNLLYMRSKAVYGVNHCDQKQLNRIKNLDELYCYQRETSYITHTYRISLKAIVICN